MQKHYLVTFLQAICVEAPEDTDNATIMAAGRKYMLDNYKSVEDFVGSQDCSSIEEVGGEYNTKIRIIEEIMDDVDFGIYEEEPQVTIIK